MPHLRGLLTPTRRLSTSNHVTRDLLAILNREGESALRERREILKRVVEFGDFSVCWENDRAAAIGLASQVRDLVSVKDSFTRMRIEKDDEKRKRIEVQERELKAKQEKGQRREKVRADFFSLFGVHNAQERGKLLELALGDLFASHGLQVREAFTVKGRCGRRGHPADLNGTIALEGQLYLVETKWWNAPLGTGDIAPHLVRVYNRGGQARGLFISYTDFTEPAIEQCRSALAGGAVIVPAKLDEIVSLLNKDGNLENWLKVKVEAAVAERNPLPWERRLIVLREVAIGSFALGFNAL